jgi:hypothetical protein
MPERSVLGGLDEPLGNMKMEEAIGGRVGGFCESEGYLRRWGFRPQRALPRKDWPMTWSEDLT